MNRQTGDRHERQRGQAIVLVALMMVAMFGMAALAFDAGLAMSDRRILQADVDSAALAGARSYPRGSNQANFVALQYLGGNLGFSVPSGACTASTNCPPGTYTFGTYTVTVGNPGNQTIDLSAQHSQPSIFGRVIGSNTLVAGTSARATPPGPVLTGALYALAAVSGDALVHGGGTSNPTGNVSGPVYAYGSFGSNNAPHAPDLPSTQTNYDGTACSGSPQNHVDNGGIGNGYNYTWQGGTGGTNSSVAPPTVFDYASPTITSPIYTSTGQAKDTQGNWKPGVYSGIYPSGGKMNGGVYKLVNVTSTISLGSITNTTHTASGTSEGANGVVIVLDSSDTGDIDVTNAVLNGIDDLNPQNYQGQRDPAGTHNFVLYGGDGANGYKGNFSRINPGATTDLSGIIYMPQSTLISDGRASPKWTGSVYVASLTINGNGNGTETFDWVCNLNAISGAPTDGGLTR